jgi:Spy/CpxP family protein refolding chaperone
MKPSLFALCLVGAALTTLPLRLASADNTSTAGQAAPSTGSGDVAGNDTQGQRLARLKAAMEQLNLTDAQKNQIQQIRAKVIDKKERRQQIMAVLTPDQKAKLRELIMEHKNGTDASSTPAAN